MAEDPNEDPAPYTHARRGDDEIGFKGAGFEGSIKGTHIITTLMFVGVCMCGWLLYEFKSVLTLIVSSNKYLALSIQKNTCVLTMPQEARPEQLGMNSMCESIARHSFRQMQADDEEEEDLKKKYKASRATRKALDTGE